MTRLISGQRLLMLAALTLCCNLLTTNAGACDRAKSAQLARVGIIKTLPKTQVALGAAAKHQMGSTRMPRPNNGITGLWDVKDFFQGQLFAEAFDTWNADGTEYFIDNENPATDNVCNGTWVGGDSRTYKLKHVSWTFDDNGVVNGMAVFHDKVQLSEDGNSFNGTEDVYLYDLDGHLVVEFLGDVLQAQRIEVDF